ncbi:MAG: phage baseplate assembly protein V [Lachnospiraceae bacterium]|nr:phage baseplate assembly protein V [Lachnospiraceae bacterium]
MAIFDIIEEVSKKQIEKTDTGDSRIMGVMLGKVVKNYDENMPGRVCVILLSREEVKDESGGGGGAGGAGGEENEADNSRILWPKVIMPSSGSEWGHYFIPEIGDLVLVIFEQGNIDRPYIVGCIPKKNDKILTKSKDEKNKYKKIVTKNGNSIIFEDVAGDDNNEGGGETPGEKDKITVVTALEKHHIILDNEKKLIEVSDKEKKNFVRLSTDEEKGHIEVTAAKKLTIKVGDNISLVMNGDTGAVTLKSKKFTVQTDDSMSYESQGKADFKGVNVTVEGSSMVKLSSNGAVQVSGTPIKLG